ncbi:MAG: hypothetical protein WC527_05665 [Candidatus Margulisiibacteriota bacterium]
MNRTGAPRMLRAAHGTASDLRLIDTDLRLVEVTGWPAGEVIKHVILVSDNTGTLTERTDKPIREDIHAASLSFLSNPDNALLVNSGDPESEMRKSQTIFRNALAAMDWADRYHMIAATGRTQEDYRPDGEKSFSRIEPSWSLSFREDAAHIMMLAFMRAFHAEADEPKGTFVNLFKQPELKKINDAFGSALKRFEILRKYGLWGKGIQGEVFKFKLLSRLIGPTFGGPYIYDVGSALVLELQDTKSVLDAYDPTQDDSRRFAKSVVDNMLRWWHVYPGTFLIPGATFVLLSKITKAQAVVQSLGRILSDINPEENTLVIIMGDGTNDIETFGINLSRYKNVRRICFYLNHSPMDADELPPHVYLSCEQRLDGSLGILQWANLVSGRRVGDVPDFEAKQWWSA